MKIFLAPSYLSSLKKLTKNNPQLLPTIKKKIEYFKTDPQTPGLKLHKLKGSMQTTWSFSVTDDIRILYIYEEDGIMFVKIGKHEDVY
ncbi:MAG: type II toxin-antitoxin system mRNA interferase toxin, RelE/StbE family [Patescibacteria group bacterium]